MQKIKSLKNKALTTFGTIIVLALQWSVTSAFACPPKRAPDIDSISAKLVGEDRERYIADRNLDHAITRFGRISERIKFLVEDPYITSPHKKEALTDFLNNPVWLGQNSSSEIISKARDSKNPYFKQKLVDQLNARAGTLEKKLEEIEKMPCRAKH